MIGGETINKRQKLVQEQFLNNEEKLLNKLENQYSHALKDINKTVKELQNQINELDVMIRLATDETDKATLLSMHQSKVYQKQYQDALKKQISSILDNLQVEEFKTIDEYLKKCYEDGFIGTMYDLQGQGIPLCFPLDQEAIIRAVQLDSKISEGLYKHLGENVAELKKKISSQVSRGISTGMTYGRIAQQIEFRMMGTYDNPGGAFAYAMRIARTEGHRIQIQSGMDACYKAQDSGADVVKQWDSTLDGDTRPSHKKVDGEIRELDEPFSNGLMHPGDPAGGAKEVINCRCALLQRARWALDDDELETLKERAKFYGLDKTKNFDDFKSKYLVAVKDELHEKTLNKARTVEEFEEILNDYRKTFDNTLARKSKWSGNVLIDDEYLDGINALGAKPWSCDIKVKSNAANTTVLHELMHSYSGSYVTPEEYYQNGYETIEEATVAFFAENYLKSQGKDYHRSYQKLTNVLYTVNKGMNLYETDLEFATALINVPLPQRFDWLNDQVYNSLKRQKATQDEMNAVIAYVENLLKG